MTAITHNTNQVNLFALLANKIKSSIGIEIWSLEQHRTYKQLDTTHRQRVRRYWYRQM